MHGNGRHEACFCLQSLQIHSHVSQHVKWQIWGCTFYHVHISIIAYCMSKARCGCDGCYVIQRLTISCQHWLPHYPSAHLPAASSLPISAAAVTQRALEKETSCFCLSVFFASTNTRQASFSIAEENEKSVLEVRMATVTQSTLPVDPQTCKGRCLCFFLNFIMCTSRREKQTPKYNRIRCRCFITRCFCQFGRSGR